MLCLRKGCAVGRYGAGHDPGKPARDVLVLLCRFNGCQNLLDAHTHIGATRNLLYLSDGSLLVSIREGTRMLQHLRKLRLCVDVWYRNVCVETAEEIQLSEHRTFRRRRENQ